MNESNAKTPILFTMDEVMVFTKYHKSKFVISMEDEPLKGSYDGHPVYISNNLPNLIDNKELVAKVVEGCLMKKSPETIADELNISMNDVLRIMYNPELHKSIFGEENSKCITKE